MKQHSGMTQQQLHSNVTRLENVWEGGVKIQSHVKDHIHVTK